MPYPYQDTACCPRTSRIPVVDAAVAAAEVPPDTASASEQRTADKPPSAVAEPGYTAVHSRPHDS